MLDTKKSTPSLTSHGDHRVFFSTYLFPPNPKFLLRPYPPPWVTDIFRHCVTMSFLTSFVITESSCGAKCVFPPCPCTLYHKCLFQRYQLKTIKQQFFSFPLLEYVLFALCFKNLFLIFNFIVQLP